MTENLNDCWRKFSSCKKPIDFGARYFVCSVSTCNSLRTGYVFCTVHCFERHLPGARHKDAAAVEKIADRAQVGGGHAAGSDAQTETRTPTRVFAQSQPGQKAQSTASVSREVLVIASRLKEYIHARSEYNTSASVFDVLSDHLRIVCDRAIDNARAEGRKTVMDRDFMFLKN